MTMTAARAADAPPKLPGVSEKMLTFVKDSEVSGVVTLVANSDGIIHLSAEGLADIEANKPMQPDSLFWIASMTKPVTGVAMMMLVDEGKLAIDDPVAKYIPEFANLKKPDGSPANLTVRHLMTHTSGLSEVSPEVGKTATKLADLIPSFLSKPTQFVPGSKWQYCQSGINTGGRIVEVISGMSYPEFLQKRLFDPLGMTDTSFYPPKEKLDRLADSYKKDGMKLAAVPIAFLNGKSPSDTNRYPLANGGLFSTAKDYGTFLRMVLNKGSLDGKTYLSPKAVEQMTSVLSGDVVTGFTPGNGWGFGWCIIREPQGVSAKLSPGSHGHGGAYGTQAWIDPKAGLAHVLMIQRTNFSNPGGSDGSPVRQGFHEAVSEALKK
ncbi:serine hydrolase domain-containing protein [Humisphaera borealis]|uniref:Beta-lactamase family protein n=1 Tax=Humisphaera borealis TaxID=2807512 RepID=A0A7M2WX11_9BACT|nr:serine hydrolase domain-containing protein [Humisphaera borealis]QOV90035.1 beta-lactamase family protein [Humisphaera borealis]